jgi:hypothetical protein
MATVASVPVPWFSDTVVVFSPRVACMNGRGKSAGRKSPRVRLLRRQFHGSRRVPCGFAVGPAALSLPLSHVLQSRTSRMSMFQNNNKNHRSIDIPSTGRIHQVMSHCSPSGFPIFDSRRSSVRAGRPLVDELPCLPYTQVISIPHHHHYRMGRPTTAHIACLPWYTVCVPASIYLRTYISQHHVPL